MAQSIFWVGMAILIYTYIGYGILLFFFIKIKRIFHKKSNEFIDDKDLPSLTLVIPCYNEESYIEAKIKNCLDLVYPPGKYHILFVTDGSTDMTNARIEAYQDRVQLAYSPERRGKNAAVNRIMPSITTPIVVFCDANTMLNRLALKNIACHFLNKQVGAVAGEKRVKSEEGDAAGSGEGAYWKYESTLKRWDSELHTVVGAAGELFAIRTSLYSPVPENVIIEDFRLSMSVAKQGYKVVYEPDAYAVESASASIEEENKRKVRISAGGLQEVVHFIGLLNIFKYGWLSFQYISHRMLRWTLAPLALPVVFITNCILALEGSFPYLILLTLQVAFYLLAFLGYALRHKSLGPLFIPYYFFFMNLSVYQGLIRLIKGSQSVVWEKAKRAK